MTLIERLKELLKFFETAELALDKYLFFKALEKISDEEIKKIPKKDINEDYKQCHSPAGLTFSWGNLLFSKYSPKGAWSFPDDIQKKADQLETLQAELKEWKTDPKNQELYFKAPEADPSKAISFSVSLQEV